MPTTNAIERTSARNTWNSPNGRARAAPTPNRVYRPEPSGSYLFWQFAGTDLGDFANEVPKIPRVRLAVFNEAL